MRSTLSLSIAAFALMGCTQNHSGDKYDTNPAEIASSSSERERRNSETNGEFAKRMAKMPTRTPGNNHPALTELTDSTKALGNSFAVKAADAFLAEVSYSELAVKKTKNQKILDFAQMMMEDHSAATQELKKLAAEKSVELPTSCTSCESTYKSLHDQGTVEFNRQYVAMMISDHETAVKLFSEEANNGTDPEMKAWAKEKLPVLQHHLSTALALAGETDQHEKTVSKKPVEKPLGNKIEDGSTSAQSDDRKDNEDKKAKRKNRKKNRKSS